MRESNFDNIPFVAVTDASHECASGWDKIAADLKRAITKSRTEKPILIVECFPGVDEVSVSNELQARLAPMLAIQASEAYHPPERIAPLVAPFLDGKDRGRRLFQRLSLVNFFDAEPLWRLRRTIDELKSGLVLIVGCGASLIAWGHVLVYADLSRREARLRLRHQKDYKFGGENSADPATLEKQRSFLVDSGVVDRWKRPLIKRWDYLLDTHNPSEPKMAHGADVLSGLHSLATRPFSIPQFPDPAARESQGLTEAGNPARELRKSSRRGLDHALEEHSVSLGFGDVRIEVPANDLIFSHPQAFLGEAVHARFGHEFPILFDFAQSIGGYEPLGSGDGWKELRATAVEQAGIEARRYLFRKTVIHDTCGGVNVLTLVEGEEAIIESPEGAFEPMMIRQGETFVIPAAVGQYALAPNGPSAGKEITVIKALIKAPKFKANPGSS